MIRKSNHIPHNHQLIIMIPISIKRRMLQDAKMTRSTVMIRGNMVQSPLLHHMATTWVQMATSKNQGKTTQKMRRRCRLPIRKFKKEFKLMMKIMIKLKQRGPVIQLTSAIWKCKESSNKLRINPMVIITIKRATPKPKKDTSKWPVVLDSLTKRVLTNNNIRIANLIKSRKVMKVAKMVIHQVKKWVLKDNNRNL